MNELEKSSVKFVARLAGWLGPLPNAFFVARSSLSHLQVPLAMAILIGAILELLGLATIHTALDLYTWNVQPNCNKEKGAWQKAPFGLAATLCGIYLLAVLFLSVVLETMPQLAHWAPALFPLVAAVGATTLAIISQHEARVARYLGPRTASRKASRKASKERPTGRPNRIPDDASPASRLAPGGAQDDAQDDVLGRVNRSRQARREAALEQMLDIYQDNPQAGPTEVARQLRVGRSTVYNYLDELVTRGLVRRNGDGVRVL